MVVHKSGQGLAGEQHQANGDYHCRHHDRQVIDHPHGGNHGVERKDSVQHHDLRDHRPEFRPLTLGRVGAIFPFQPFVELHGGFKEQEEAAEQHNQIAGAEA